MSRKPAPEDLPDDLPEDDGPPRTDWRAEFDDMFRGLKWLGLLAGCAIAGYSLTQQAPVALACLVAGCFFLAFARIMQAEEHSRK